MSRKEPEVSKPETRLVQSPFYNFDIIFFSTIGLTVIVAFLIAILRGG